MAHTIPLTWRCLAEVLGTFLLVFLGCGAVHSAVLTGALSGLWQVAVVWALGVALAIYTIGGISGAHINPAMTVAFAAWGRFPWSEVVPYILAQVGGAFAAAAVLFLLYGPFLAEKERQKSVTRGGPGSEITAMCYGEFFPNPGKMGDGDSPYRSEDHDRHNTLVSEPAAFAAEMLATLLLALVVFAVTDERNAAAPPGRLAPAFIGLTVAALIVVIAPLTQACFNPARDLGPRLFAYLAGWGNAALGRGTGYLTVYLLAPTLGAVVGGGLYTLVLRPRLPEPANEKSVPMTRTLFLLTLGLMACVLPAARTADATKLDPELPYQAKKSDAVTYDVEFVAVVTPPYRAKVLKVWLPLPQSDVGQKVGKGEIATFPMEVEPKVGREKVHGNTFAYFEFAKPEGARIIRHRFKVEVWELRWNLDPEKVTKVARWPASFRPYLESDNSVVVDDRFRDAVKKAVPKSRGPARDLADVLDWVNGQMKYDHAAGSLCASSEHALETKSGHCSDYHGLCASFGRALGYPTRVTYGINTFPKNSPSHCKLEAYLPPYGWVSFDVSETQKLIADLKKDTALDAKKKDELIQAATKRLRDGFRDNTWFLQTRGTDYDLEPKASKRVPVVRTIYAEADGVALPEPDPANAKKREFGWMTAHKYTPDRKVLYPFKDYKSLLPRE